MDISVFDQTVADRICERLAEGESLRTICKDDGFPRTATVFRWLADDRLSAFREQYARAREAQAHNLADEIIEISNTPLEGVEVTTDDKGATSEKRGDMLGHRKLQVDSRKWYLSKVLPKVYGDKLELSGNPDAPLQVTVQRLTEKAK
jgi:hypothetical protein